MLADLSGKIDINVLSDDLLFTDLILGLDFFTANDISLVMHPNKELLEERLKLFSEVVSAEVANDWSKDFFLSNIETDFDQETTDKLTFLIS